MPLKSLEEILDRDKLALRNIAQIGPRRQKDRRRKLRQKVIRQIEVEIEAGEVAVFLFLDFVNMKLREQHASFGMIGMRQRQKACRERVLRQDFFRIHRPQRVPGRPRL